MVARVVVSLREVVDPYFWDPQQSVEMVEVLPNAVYALGMGQHSYLLVGVTAKDFFSVCLVLCRC